MPTLARYSPAPITAVYRITVFNASGNGVAEFETAPGLLLDSRKTVCQNVAEQIPDGYTVHVFEGVHTLGRSRDNSKRIIWD